MCCLVCGNNAVILLARMNVLIGDLLTLQNLLALRVIGVYLKLKFPMAAKFFKNKALFLRITRWKRNKRAGF